MPNGNARGRRKREMEKIFKITMTKKFPHINVRYQTTDSIISENTKREKYSKNQHLGISYSKYRKSKIKKKIPKESRGKEILYL